MLVEKREDSGLSDRAVEASYLVAGRPRVAVIGPEDASDDALRGAESIGRTVGRIKGWIITGGRGGVMEAACKGARDVGGLAVGILPSSKASQANPHVSLAIPTGMDEARDAVVVNTADVIIAVEPSPGTVAELALAVKGNKPIVTIGHWDLPDTVRQGVVAVGTAEEAVVWALTAVGVDTINLGGQEIHDTPRLEPSLEDRAKLLDGIQRHYESDLALHSSRMSLFLVAEAGLLGFAIHNASGSAMPSFADAHRGVIAGFGSLITIMWLLVGSVSWKWVSRFRKHLIEEARAAHIVDYGTAAVHIQREKDSFLFRVLLRPTFILGVALPLPFLVAWIWFGFNG